MKPHSRRTFVAESGASLLALGMSHLLLNTGVASDEGMESLQQWLGELCRLGRQLGSAEITQAEWQSGMDEIYGRTPLHKLLRFVDFSRVSQEMSRRNLEGRGEVFDTLFVGSPGQSPIKGTSAPGRVLISKIAHIRKGRSIPPHGHSNMVSAFLNISGDFHVRQFDKLRDEGHSLVVRATTNTRATPGSWSSISDERNNVHWITAKSDDCFLFTSKLIHLEEQRQSLGRIHIDVRAAKNLGRGSLRAPKIDYEDAMAKY